MDAERKSASSRLLRRATEAVFPLGAFQKTTDPHKAIENLERASGKATLWILAGIIVELGALFLFPHGWGERSVSIVAYAAIGFGLIVEYLVIGKVIDATREAERVSNERVADLERLAAEANRKAKEAELALAKLEARLAPRSLALRQHLMTPRLSEFAGQRATIVAAPSMPESEMFARHLGPPLLDAGWQVEILPGTPVATTLEPTGVIIQYDVRAFDHNNFDVNRDVSPAAARLAELLTEFEIEARAVPALTEPPGAINIIVSTK